MSVNTLHPGRQILRAAARFALPNHWIIAVPVRSWNSKTIPERAEPAHP